MTKIGSNRGSASDHPSTHETENNDKKKDSSSNHGGGQGDMDAAVNAFAQQLMMQIFQDQQTRDAEDREDDPDAA
ncbi:hypothetical protein WI61_30070 [Burkholderia cepacia]|uniref:hypothetical protein n=1 Tax=Burkholderia cepacia TaxID=292 RepID=UPI00075E32EC|nr:hypothetical protein [Burkholderia cepacia]KVA55281.1 hypothetical protein WI48_19975 [Burkholderia cepacia]KVA58965.1 hypothetical protein WI47_34610 [Burkholderia cepacia]KVA70669.1 hypothetical protein WI49_36465 [Burkholderia cepacia]KVA83053.1 hypothetical protein WI50_21390 [Burkholderia cepacia]KVA89467.1 hypothetical protein WI51_13160 [Burkholderia cepacia]